MSTLANAQPVDSLAALAAHSPAGFGDLRISFSNLDATHMELCVIGYLVVFLVLLGLAVMFNQFQRLLKQRVKPAGTADVQAAEEDVPGEINAAIAMALHLHFGALHDRENTVLTIERRQATYSPWSSKIYGVRGFGQRSQRPVTTIPNRFPLKVQEH
jgi:Na+-transporting methylmalonyl-CoA/oxaloacetate decarboxylase gamma subunit